MEIGATKHYDILYDETLNSFSFTNYLAIEFLDCKGCSNPSEEMIQYTEKLLGLVASGKSSVHYSDFSIDTKAIA